MIHIVFTFCAMLSTGEPHCARVFAPIAPAASGAVSVDQCKADMAGRPPELESGGVSFNFTCVRGSDA